MIPLILLGNTSGDTIGLWQRDFSDTPALEKQGHWETKYPTRTNSLVHDSYPAFPQQITLFARTVTHEALPLHNLPTLTFSTLYSVVIIFTLNMTRWWHEIEK